MQTRAVMRYYDSSKIVADITFDYSSDEKLGEEIGELVATARKAGKSATNVEIVITMHEEFPEPLNLKDELPRVVVNIIKDGYAATSRDDCPYERNNVKEATARVLWLRGFAFKQNGKSLDDAFSIGI